MGRSAESDHPRASHKQLGSARSGQQESSACGRSDGAWIGHSTCELSFSYRPASRALDAYTLAKRVLLDCLLARTRPGSLATSLGPRRRALAVIVAAWGSLRSLHSTRGRSKWTKDERSTGLGRRRSGKGPTTRRMRKDGEEKASKVSSSSSSPQRTPCVAQRARASYGADKPRVRRACVNQPSSSQPMPTRAECPPGICPRPQFQCGQFSTTGGSKSGDVAYLAGQRQPAERERGGTDDSLKAPNDSHPSLVRPGTFKRCREQLEISW